MNIQMCMIQFKQALYELDVELDKEKAETYELLCELFNVE